MNNRVNYTLVGILVLVGIVFMVSFAYWMLKPAAESETKIYSIHFDESVLGLNLDAPVKYRGISVGKVISIGINERNAQQVRVLVSILRSTPIKEDTVAQLTAQGITGLSYINLNLGTNSAKQLEAADDDEYPVIQTVPSFLTNFEESFSSVSSSLSTTLGKTEELLSDANQEELSNILKRTANVMQKMDRLLNEETIEHLQNSAKNIDNFTYKMDKVVPNIDNFIDRSVLWEDKISHSFESIMKSYLGIQSSMLEIKRAVASGEFNIKEITSDLVPTINTSFIQMQEMMIKLESTLKEYNKSPSDILYKRTEIKKDPGEK